VINNGTSAGPPPYWWCRPLSQRKAGIRAEEVRAIDASARHTLGSSRLSERDGAGAIMLAVADTVVANGLSKLFSNNGAASNFPINSTFTASTGRKSGRDRLVSQNTAGSTMTQPTTDLDLN